MKRLNHDTMSDKFSSFSDDAKYHGRLPMAKYMAHVYKLFHATIRDHLDNKVKKRGAETMHWGVSYKEAKHFKKTRTDYGLPGVHTFLTDDPARDKLYFPRILESLKKQQQILDSKSNLDPVPSLPECIYNPLLTRIAQTSADIDRCVAAMRTTMGGRKIVGFDLEWKVAFQHHGTGAGDNTKPR